jgi:hypothetical protein
MRGFSMKSTNRHLCAWFREIFPWLLGAAVMISSNWAAAAISETFSYVCEGPVSRLSPSPLRIGYVLLYVVIWYFIIRWRNTFLPPRTRYLTSETAEKRKHLVLFLSKLPDQLSNEGGIPSYLCLTTDLANDIRQIRELKCGPSGHPHWQWEMPLCAIFHHLGKLETVTLVCSSESMKQVSLFLRICMNYEDLKPIMFFALGNGKDNVEYLQVTSPEDTGALKGFNFESFDELSDAMGVLRMKFKEEGRSESQIMIDITGGQKPTSIVGAAMTINRRIKAQYIQTNYPWRVLSYDVVMRSSDIPGVGL